MGMVVTAFAATVAKLPLATITATRRRTRSATSEVSRSIWFSAYRYSMATFCPSTYPASFRTLEKWNSDVLVVIISGLAAEPPNHRHSGLLGPRHHRHAAALPSPAMMRRPPVAGAM
jgi:hypothetical protein